MFAVACSAVTQYLTDVLWSWQGLALAVLGLNELSEWLLQRSFKWLHRLRWPIAIALLFAAQGFVYHDLATTQKPPLSATVIAENPDHANLVERLDKANERIKAIERERDDEHNARVAAEARVQELERRVTSQAERKVLCGQLASLSAAGRDLVTKLRTTRAATETRHEIDKWYEAVCAALSRPQCEAFLAAPRKSDSWANYPTDDGGYSQTLRGRSDHLSSRLASLCA
jgi:hypothetical protein